MDATTGSVLHASSSGIRADAPTNSPIFDLCELAEKLAQRAIVDIGGFEAIDQDLAECRDCGVRRRAGAFDHSPACLTGRVLAAAKRARYRAEGVPSGGAATGIVRLFDAEGVEVSAGGARTFVIDAFVEAMNDIGRYGHEKYGADSFQSRRLAGDVSRGALLRTTPTAIRAHAVAHFNDYMTGQVHDHFGTRKHQLAAVAFNAMMEFYFAGLERDEAPSTARPYFNDPYCPEAVAQADGEPSAAAVVGPVESDESWEASKALLRHTPKCGVLGDDESLKCTLPAGHAGDHFDRVVGAGFAREIAIARQETSQAFVQRMRPQARVLRAADDAWYVRDYANGELLTRIMDSELAAWDGALAHVNGGELQGVESKPWPPVPVRPDAHSGAVENA